MIDNIKNTYHKEEAVSDLAEVYGYLLKMQNIEDAQKTLQCVEALPSKYKVKLPREYQEKIVEILTDCFSYTDYKKANWAITQIERIRSKKSNDNSKFTKIVIIELGHRLYQSDWFGYEPISDYIVDIANRFYESEAIISPIISILFHSFWGNGSDKNKAVDRLEQLYIKNVNKDIWVWFLLVAFMLAKDKDKKEIKAISTRIHELWSMYKGSDETDIIPEIILFGRYENDKFAVMMMAPKELNSTHEESIMDAILSMKEVMGERIITFEDLVFPEPGDFREYSMEEPATAESNE